LEGSGKLEENLPAAAPYFFLLLVLLTVLPGAKRWRDPTLKTGIPRKPLSISDKKTPQLLRTDGTGKLLAWPETDSMIELRTETRKIEEQKIESRIEY
jgi:hypothetical protein